MSEISPLVRLVDDDDAFRESQKLFLSMCGYEVKDWADPVRFLQGSGKACKGDGGYHTCVRKRGDDVPR